MVSLYKIKSNYIHRDNPRPFDDTPNTDKWQYEVYELAHTIALIIPKLPVLDIGCGSGYKLVNIFKEFDTLGIELEETYKFLIEKYPEKKWEIKTNIPPKEKFGVVILADVLEHLNDPDEMMKYIEKINFEYLIISTPNRDNLELSQNGPPKNDAHAREWSSSELREYIGQYLNVVNQYDTNKNQKTQCIIAKKNEITPRHIV